MHDVSLLPIGPTEEAEKSQMSAEPPSGLLRIHHTHNDTSIVLSHWNFLVEAKRPEAGSRL